MKSTPAFNMKVCELSNVETGTTVAMYLRDFRADCNSDNALTRTSINSDRSSC